LFEGQGRKESLEGITARLGIGAGPGKFGRKKKRKATNEQKKRLEKKAWRRGGEPLGKANRGGEKKKRVGGKITEGGPRGFCLGEAKAKKGVGKV